MAVLVRLVSENAEWIYGLCAMAALLLLRTAILARRERRQAVFSLEREAALNRTLRAFRLSLLVIVLMAAAYLTRTYLSTAVEPIIAQADPTPTPVFLLNTPTPTQLPPTVTPTVTPTPRPRATPRPIPTATPGQAAVVIVPPTCPDPRAVILQPGSGQQVAGAVQIIGTAQAGNFQYYKIEFKPAGAAGDFNFYLRRDSAVVNGPLGTWDTGGLPAGAYLLRLVTVDITGNFGDCTVQVSVRG